MDGQQTKWLNGYHAALAGQPADQWGMKDSFYAAGYAKGQAAREEMLREEAARGQVLRMPPRARRNFQQTPPPFRHNWRTEKGLHYRPPVWVQVLVARDVLKDASWHNDTGASFVLPGRDRDLVIWVEHEDPEERESSEWLRPGGGFIRSGPRYALHLLSHEPSDIQGHGRLIEDVQIWSGDDEDALRDAFFRNRFEMGM